MVAARDRSYFQVWAGLVDAGNAYTVRWVGNASSGGGVTDPDEAAHLWEATFYKDGSIVLVTGQINGYTSPTQYSANDPTGIASESAWLAQMDGIYPYSAYLFTPQDARGNAWKVEKKA